MSSLSLEQSFKQVKHYSQAELLIFCERLTAALYTGQPADCIHFLRKLYLIIHSSNTSKCLPAQLMDGLMKILLVPDESRWPAKLLATILLAEVAPSTQINVPTGSVPWDNKQVPHVLTVVLNQAAIGNELFENILPQLIRWISTVGYSVLVQSRSLTALGTIARTHPESITRDHGHIVNSQMVEWLRSASLQQAVNPYASSIFRKDADKQPPITEIDGTSTSNFFTALCIGQYYTTDQLMNITSFSSLRAWLHHSGHIWQPGRNGSPIAEEKPLSNALSDASLQYSMRIIEQCERRCKVPSDNELQSAALIEAVSLLDHLCSKDPAIVPRVFDTMKRILNQRASGQPRLMICLLQFFINHGDAVMYDSSQVYDTLFGSMLSSAFGNAAVSFEIGMFLRDNLPLLCDMGITMKYFPNILKLLAWNPRSFVVDYMDILPACLSPSTTLEVVHTLLDLPCVTGCLELSMHHTKSARTSRGSSSTSSSSPVLPPQACQKAYQSPEYSSLFKYMLRAQAGFGDTINKLEHVHKLLSAMCKHPRVVCCAQAVPPLLRRAFEVILEGCDETMAGNIVPMVLERSALLFNVAEYKEEIRKELAWFWSELLSRFPKLAVENYTEILEYTTLARNLTSIQHVPVHVLWTVGEFISSRHHPACSAAVLASVYEALETTAYELVGILQSSAVEGSSRLITTLMSTLAKLSSRSQDLIPRAILCVSKLGQLASCQRGAGVAQAISERAAELVALLKLPNIAALILSPPEEMDKQRWHRDCTKLPILLQATHNILKSQTQTPSSQTTIDADNLKSKHEHPDALRHKLETTEMSESIYIESVVATQNET